MKLLPILITVISTISSSLAIREVLYNLDVSYFEGRPDGVPKRILGFNKQFPGPTIRAQRYDILTVRVTNSIEEGETTTIHWHGLEQYLTPWEDGPRMLMQCDIPFNATYEYQFQVNQTGTYWYHSHHSSQYSEGLWGVKIIDNVPEVHNYDGEFLLTLSDWFHLPAHTMSDWYQNTSASRGGMPYPDSALINGEGYYPCEYASLKNMSCDPSFKERYKLLEVERGKVYRFRVVNPSTIVLFAFSIDDHKLETIETDGVDTIRTGGVDRVTVSTGARYSFLVKMDGDLDQYWIRSWGDYEPYKLDFPNINPYPEAQYNNPVRMAVLRYKDAAPSSPPISTVRGLTNPDAIQGRPEIHERALLDSMLVDKISHLQKVTPSEVIDGLSYYSNDPLKLPYASLPFPTTLGEADPVTLYYMDCKPISGEQAPDYVNQSIVLYIPNIDDPNNHYKPGFNNITYDASTLDKPGFVSMLQGEPLSGSLHPITINGFGHDYVVEIILNDYGDTGHPFHLHGHTFWVMGYGGFHDGPFNEERDRPKLRSGVRKETMAVAWDSWVVLRFRADSPGLWLFHCHMNFHFEAAIGLIFVEGMDLAKDMFRHELPQKVEDLCKLSGIEWTSIDQNTDPPPAKSSSCIAFLHNYVSMFVFAIILAKYLTELWLQVLKHL